MPGVLLSARSGLSWILLVFLAFTFVPQVQADEAPAWLADLLARDRITVVVTDSGLGGLAVVADAAEKFRHHAVFEAVDLVFVNALFREAGGYNSLPTREQKLEVFDSALRAMANRYQPDLILVACNTLSVLASDTAFAREGGVPVVGIVDMGVEQIADRLLADTGTVLAQLATEEPSLQSTLNRAAQTLAALSDLDPALRETQELLETAGIQIDEAASSLRHYRDRVELDPQQSYTRLRPAEVRGG